MKAGPAQRQDRFNLWKKCSEFRTRQTGFYRNCSKIGQTLDKIQVGKKGGQLPGSDLLEYTVPDSWLGKRA